MPPGSKLAPEKCEAILASVRAGGKSVRAIAKEHGVAPTTVSELAKRHGVHDAFDRSQTEAATQAHAADCRLLREQLKAELLDDAQKLRKRAWSEYEVVLDSRVAGPTTITLKLPPLADVRAAYAALGIALDKSMRLEQYDSTDSDVDAKSMIGALADGLRAYAQATPDPEGADTED